MSEKSKGGWSTVIDGKMKSFPAGADVPDDIVKACKLAEKQLLASPGGAAGSSPGTKKKVKNDPAKPAKNFNANKDI